MAITTTTNWKAYRRIASSTYDTAVAAVIPSVQDEIERYISRKVESDDYIETVSGDGSPDLYVRNWPVTAITSVTHVSDGGVETTLAATDYRCIVGDDNRGHIRRLPYVPPQSGAGRYVDEWGTNGCRPVWQEGYGNYVVAYTGGYATVPGDIEMAAWMLIDTKLEGQGFGIYTQQVGQGNENKAMRSAADSMAEYRRLLGPFRRLP
jgi:hypothetical protein